MQKRGSVILLIAYSASLRKQLRGRTQPLSPHRKCRHHTVEDHEKDSFISRDFSRSTVHFSTRTQPASSISIESILLSSLRTYLHTSYVRQKKIFSAPPKHENMIDQLAPHVCQQNRAIRGIGYPEDDVERTSKPAVPAQKERIAMRVCGVRVTTRMGREGAMEARRLTCSGARSR